MKIQHSMAHILVTTAMAFAVVPAMAQGVAQKAKTDMPAVSGNVFMPAGQQNQTGGPMGETGTTLQVATPAAPMTAAPVRMAAPAPAPAPAPVAKAAPAPAPVQMVAAPAPAPAAAPAPVAAPMRAPEAPARPMRRARADRG
jgi:hypothetical protein